jgi:hypothetical protein
MCPTLFPMDLPPPTLPRLVKPATQHVCTWKRMGPVFHMRRRVRGGELARPLGSGSDCSGRSDTQIAIPGVPRKFRSCAIPKTRFGLQHVAMIATAIGAVAVGAMAIGALAIGRSAIRRVMIDRSEFKSLEIQDSP